MEFSKQKETAKIDKLIEIVMEMYGKITEMDNRLKNIEDRITQSQLNNRETPVISKDNREEFIEELLNKEGFVTSDMLVSKLGISRVTALNLMYKVAIEKGYQIINDRLNNNRKVLVRDIKHLEARKQKIDSKIQEIIINKLSNGKYTMINTHEILQEDLFVGKTEEEVLHMFKAYVEKNMKDYDVVKNEKYIVLIRR